MELYALPLHEARRLLETGEVSSVALTESVLARIEAVEPKVQSYLTLDREGALRQAEQADIARKNGQGGPLCGIPLAIKDVLCTTTMPTTCGSRILENFVAPYEATVVTKLAEAGSVLVGKLAMDEFAMGSTSENCAFKVPHNPWKLGYVAGGSSGGSAAAVAADECFASLGSDTGGSIRQPASLCGTVGMKPTYGRVSRYGLVAFASSLDQVGPLTKEVRDCALMMNAISGHDPKDSTSIKLDVPDFTASLQDGLKGVKIGLPREYFVQGLDPEVDRAVRDGIRMLQEAGAELVEVTLPHTDYCVAVYYLIAPAEASSNLARFDGVRYGYRDRSADSLIEMYNRTRSQGFGDEVKRRILIGTYALSSGYYDAYYKKASQVRTLIKDDFAKAFAHCDLMVSPVCPTPAWKIGDKADDPLALYLSDILTLSANLAGVPGMSVPCGFSSDGLPIGLQLQAAHFNEEILLRAAYNLEQRAGVVGKKPVIA
ncbi:aspartyl/glutamyl-tRNA(Asn/Gln) amidotransferase subunit A [Desulfobulbus propionicus DSM 2032]|uniref:Glutamyl-tRNA(Gln) amidotransferase subunit A n=1 Tax=Desulfobulbus propionicus (strain ATCC 33891 / DSM 2032 / VKM B-1956 / 1pr3) TaxID=577650 RepID=A0A7U4DQV1_DESPD|nr:Asp-tRNA(Asn)/Glu-tRNA(Gln) amidotransferase subunit GatA [Desulfobulbus propionicus]ADW19432.1 aspartyl/glutamyl-tRNA(Asn/Gln) amidotransferase subunit A [Desulfobulbus propionicus DSM 2032]